MQTDNTLNLSEPSFIKKEQTEFKYIGFKAKPVQMIDIDNKGMFNSYIFKVFSDKLVIQQKG